MRRGEWIGIPDWNKEYSRRLPTPTEIQFWSRWPDAGIGVVCGAASKGLVGIDIDTDDAAIAGAIKAALPPTTVVKKGSKGETRCYVGPGIVSQSWNIDGKRVLDLLSDGRQTVLPPSVHPETNEPYSWIGPDTLEDLNPEDLPVLPADIAERISEALRPFGYTAEPEHTPVTEREECDEDSWHRKLNDAALSQPHKWVPALGLKRWKGNGARYEAVNQWRESSEGRPFEKRKLNLKFHPEGIRDFGENKGYTALDIVMMARDCPQGDAFVWLAERLGWAPDQKILLQAPTVRVPSVAEVIDPVTGEVTLVPKAVPGVPAEWAKDDEQAEVATTEVIDPVTGEVTEVVESASHRKKQKLPTKVNKHGALVQVPSKLTLDGCYGPDGALSWPNLKLGWNGGMNPTDTVANARVALLALRLDLSYDTFHDRLLIAGNQITESVGELSDRICSRLCTIIFQQYHFDPSPHHVHEAAVQLCIQNAFNPVLGYLDSLTWDGENRIGNWMTKYFSAPNTDLNQAIGAISLVAAVRRVRNPGTKFDQIIVLEGPEGTNKSSAIELMAGKDNFSDQTILGLEDRTQMERTKGVWLYEIADLSGITKADVDAVKAFVSRTHDRARPVFCRSTINQPRRCVFFATTNNKEYLLSQTGNRRFWPVPTGKIDLDGLRRDRDQLWAEAAHLEAEGMSIFLPEDMWGDARAEQEKRLTHEPWDDILEGVTGLVIRTPDGEEERLASATIFADILRIPADRMNSSFGRRLSQCMNRLGWIGPEKLRINGGAPQRGYRRPCST